MCLKTGWESLEPPLTSIPVAGPFDRVGVDVIHFPKSHLGNQYAVVEQVVSRHGVPTEVLSDRGAVFLSKLMADVNRLLGIHKVNTTAYHPQTDGGSTAP
jgi:hypothetical protein